jgi:hypothetical protein
LVVLEKRRFICRKAQGWNLLNLVLLRHKLKILLESSLFLGLDRGLGGSLHHLTGRLVLLENLGLWGLLFGFGGLLDFGDFWRETSWQRGKKKSSGFSCLGRLNNLAGVSSLQRTVARSLLSWSLLAQSSFCVVIRAGR